MADYLLGTVPEPRKNRSLIGVFCATCEINYADEIEHKNHYKTDFHLFNLKRRIHHLAPISQEFFDRSLKEILEKQKTEQVKNSKKDETKYCEFCWKDFRSNKTYVEHLKSKKHLENEKLNRKKPEQPKIEITTKQNINVCLFCNHLSDTFVSFFN